VADRRRRIPDAERLAGNGRGSARRRAVLGDGGIGVYVLQVDSTMKWQLVKTGASDPLRVEVIEGLKDGDAVAEATDGMKVVAAVKP
jgi:hypothetical protein